MGQKTNPKAFRLVTNQKHLSLWYSSKKNYNQLVQEDYSIRKFLTQKLERLLTISTIEILRAFVAQENEETIFINIKVLYPREKEIFKKLPEVFPDLVSQKISFDLQKEGNLKIFLEEHLLKFLREQSLQLLETFARKNKKLYFTNFTFIKNPFEDAMLIGKFISRQLENRIPFRRILKQAIKKVKQTKSQGIKIEVSGRLNGIEIARSEWQREGKIPLHTLRSSIDYIHHKAKTIYGIIGIKVWLFKG